jgi:hypothetical protein
VSATQVMPIFCWGLVGLFFVQKKFRREQALFLTLFLVHVFYLLNISTIGHCQFGPRYLIPLIPFTMIGLASLLDFAKNQYPFLIPVYLVSGVIAIYSIAANTLGALGDTMYCRALIESPITYYYERLDQLMNDEFYIRPFCFGVLAIELGFLIFLLKHYLFPGNRGLPTMPEGFIHTRKNL